MESWFNVGLLCLSAVIAILASFLGSSWKGAKGSHENEVRKDRRARDNQGKSEDRSRQWWTFLLLLIALLVLLITSFFLQVSEDVIIAILIFFGAPIWQIVFSFFPMRPVFFEFVLDIVREVCRRGMKEGVQGSSNNRLYSGSEESSLGTNAEKEGSDPGTKPTGIESNTSATSQPEVPETIHPEASTDTPKRPDYNQGYPSQKSSSK